ncbi:MAG: hypothetical protein ACO1SV_09325 [Fimbriimonas sp.]
MKTLVIGALALAFQGPSPEVAFKLVETGTQSKFKEGGAFVLRSDSEYNAYLKRRGFESRRAPQIDFRKDQLVAVHIGDEPIRGYTLRVLRVVRKNDTTADVEVVLDRLVQNSAAQVLRDPQTNNLGNPIRTQLKETHPYVIVRTEKFPGTVRVRIVEPDDAKRDDG